MTTHQPPQDPFAAHVDPRQQQYQQQQYQQQQQQQQQQQHPISPVPQQYQHNPMSPVPPNPVYMYNYAQPPPNNSTQPAPLMASNAYPPQQQQQPQMMVPAANGGLVAPAYNNYSYSPQKPTPAPAQPPVPHSPHQPQFSTQPVHQALSPHHQPPPPASPGVDPWGLLSAQQQQSQAPLAAANPFDGHVAAAPASPPASADVLPFRPSSMAPAATGAAPTLPGAGPPVEDLSNLTISNSASLPEEDDDFWATMGFSLATASPTKGPAPASAINKEETASSAPTEGGQSEQQPTETNSGRQVVRKSIVQQPNDPNHRSSLEDDKSADSSNKDENDTSSGLPPGRTYTAKITSYKIGAVLVRSNDLVPSLYYRVKQKDIDALGDRPVVAYTAGKSEANAKKIAAGHVLLSINGETATTPLRAYQLLSDRSSTSVTLKMLKPDFPILLAENQHMVKYDDNQIDVPTINVWDWKPKYVVVGGIICQPYMMKMYRNKEEYDRAVVDVQAGHSVSVKVKFFDLRGGMIIGDMYSDNAHGGIVQTTPKTRQNGKQSDPWYCFIFKPRKGFPIKISHPHRDGLIPVYDGIKRVCENELLQKWTTGREMLDAGNPI